MIHDFLKEYVPEDMRKDMIEIANKLNWPIDKMLLLFFLEGMAVADFDIWLSKRPEKTTDEGQQALIVAVKAIKDRAAKLAISYGLKGESGEFIDWRKAEK